MTKRTINNGHPEGGICEQFAYLSNLVAYLNGSDMHELYAIDCEVKE